MEPSAMWSVVVIFLCYLTGVRAGTVNQALLWTEKTLDGLVRIRGLPGNPQDWIDHGIPDYVTYGIPPELSVQKRSVRTALGFRHETRDLYFSDVGFRKIMRMQILDLDIVHGSVNVTVDDVYEGISSQVRGMAVDWQAGNVYWTDAVYNWITVASIDRQAAFRHIITTDLDTPVGIAIYPQKGLLFWTDQGARPKIERSSLDGSGRSVMCDTNVVRPTGITVDYSENQVFWIDDGLDTVFRINIEGGSIRGFQIRDKDDSKFQYLSGIAIFQNFIFLTDQFMMGIKIYDKNLEMTRGDIELKLSVPFDVLMYDSSIQEDFHSECKTLSCDHICINLGDERATCVCSQDYDLQDDGVRCRKSNTMSKPEYIYSVGSAICAVHVKIADLDQSSDKAGDQITCFSGDLEYAEALAVDVHGNILFFSNTKASSIRRVILDNSQITEDHIVQVGLVKGLAADWINENLYWTDDVSGQVVVSKYDGTLVKVLVDRLYQPRGLVVDPINGFMYWSTLDAIYRAYLDGDGVEVFVSHEVYAPQGMSISYQDLRLYWVDTGGINRIKLNGTGREQLYTTKDKTFKDITVYQDYLAWTDGRGHISFASADNGAVTKITTIKQDSDTISNGIVTYAESNQPISSGGDCVAYPCSQLCLVVPEGRTCHCTTGFHLHVDGRTCLSAVKDRNFVIFADPLHRIFYQLDVLSLDSKVPIEGILIRDSGFPSMIAYDMTEKILYWYDRQVYEIKRKFFLVAEHEEQVVVKLPAGNHVASMHIDQVHQVLYYTDAVRKCINFISLMDISRKKTFFVGDVVPQTFTVDVNSGWLFWLTKRPDYGYSIWRSSSEQLPERTMIVDVIYQPDVRGLTVDSKGLRLYLWNKTTIQSVTRTGGEAVTHRNLPCTDIVSMAAYAGDLYISDRGKKYLMKYNVYTEQHVNITDPLFSAIESLRIFMANFPEDSDSPPISVKTGEWNRKTTTVLSSGPEHLSSTMKSKNNVILASALSVVGFVGILVILAVVLLRRRRAIKKPSSTTFTGESHENPTYMRADEVSARTAPQSANPTRTPNGRDPTSALPAECIPPEGIPESAGVASVATPTPTDDVLQDKAFLVRHMADQSEVTVTMRNEAVAYSAERALPQ